MRYLTSHSLQWVENLTKIPSEKLYPVSCNNSEFSCKQFAQNSHVFLWIELKNTVLVKDQSIITTKVGSTPRNEKVHPLCFFWVIDFIWALIEMKIFALKSKKFKANIREQGRKCVVNMWEEITLFSLWLSCLYSHCWANNDENCEKLHINGKLHINFCYSFHQITHRTTQQSTKHRAAKAVGSGRGERPNTRGGTNSNEHHKKFDHEMAMDTFIFATHFPKTQMEPHNNPLSTE